MVELYIADAHAFARYLVDELPREADAVFEDAERQKCKVIIPSIAIAELIYVFEGTGSEPGIWEMFDKIDLYPCFSIHPLDERILKIIPDVKLTELHDRIIVATAIAIGTKKLVTKDEEIRKSRIVETIW